jgi:hypothetical protein
VTPTFDKVGDVLTVTYKPSGLLASGSVHTITLGHPAPDGQPTTTEWSFTTTSYRGPIEDEVNAYPALLFDDVVYTADGGGHTGVAGDYAMDYGTGRASVYVPDASFLNAAAANDTLTFSIWIKRADTANSSAFWINSPSSSGTARGFQAHVPWSDNNIYFDTAGCCDAATQRISAGIATFPNYTGDISWWTDNWHHFVFTKNADIKEIWIDGQLFHFGNNTSPLPTDMTDMYFGSDGAGNANFMHGLMDDYALFGTALSEADIGLLYSGTPPTQLAAGTQILAYWDFNDGAVTVAPVIDSWTLEGNSLTATWTGGGQAEIAESIEGPWTPTGNSTGTITVDITAAPGGFLRIAGN